MAGHPPSGTVTFLLTDLEGSTRLWEQNPEAMRAAMTRHDDLLETTIDRHRGFVFSRMGDGMAAAFPTAMDAVNTAAAIQQALFDEHWETARPLRARIGLHTQEGVLVDDGGYASLPINRCSRLMSAAHGGQTVVSGSTEALVRDQLPEGMGLNDLGEHRLRDLGRPTRVFQLVRAGRREDFPPLRSLDSFPGNIPTQVSSFVGRQAEVARVTKALDESRVVTITGVGGVGKTRLAIQTAADLLPRYREGAWLVELAAIRDPSGVVEAVAAAFHLMNRGAPSLEDSLIEMMAPKQLLLVLDNCEHLLGATARLVTRIEQACPDVAVLATSREGLAVEGEQLIALPPLAAGEPGEAVERLIHTDAVSLFVERARRAKADFGLAGSNARAVVEVCQRLDGVPLAIELAAARVIALSPAELVQRLDRRFHVLSGGRRGAVERHATLRAAIDWSFDLLSGAEQRLLARMAVFSGGCTLDAIEEICGGDPVEPEAVVDLVTSLVARSLVVAQDRGAGTRYRLLETIRQYAEERLAETGEADTLLMRHARFYADLSVTAGENSYGPEQIASAKQVSLERDNIRVAFTTALDARDGALAVRLVANHPHRQSHAVAPMGAMLTLPTGRIFDLVGAAEEPGYSRVLVVAAQQALLSGDFHNTERLCSEAVDAERSGSGAYRGPRIEVDVGAVRGQSALAAGAYADAVSAYRRAAEAASSDGFPGVAAICLAYSVNAALLAGCDGAEASATAEEAVALARRSGMPTAIVLTLNSLALSLVDRDPARARAVLWESIERTTVMGEDLSGGLLTACMAAGRLRDWGLTRALAARSLFFDRWAMAPLQVGPCLAECARTFADDRPEVAGVLLGAAYAAFQRAGPGSNGASQSPKATTGSSSNFLLEHLRETASLVAATLGDQRMRELRTTGASMSMDEAIAYALANIDPKLLRGPIATSTS